MMSDNTSFVLQSVGQVSYDHRPIPESVPFSYTTAIGDILKPIYTVADDEVLVQVKKTGKSHLSLWFPWMP